MVCQACGQDRDDDSQFCPWCLDLSGPVVAAVPVAVTVPDLEVPAPLSPRPVAAAPPPSPALSSLPSWAVEPEVRPRTPAESLPPTIFAEAPKSGTKWIRSWRSRSGALGSLAALLIGLTVSGVLNWDAIVHLGWFRERNAAQEVVLKRTDLDQTWTTRGTSGFGGGDTTIGITDNEAQCLHIKPLRPVTEVSSDEFDRDGMSIGSRVGVWRSRGAAARGAAVMSGQAYAECVASGLQKGLRGEAPKGRENETYVTFDSVGTLPTSVPTTRLRARAGLPLEDGGYGAVTIDLLHAFKGRTQVALWVVSGGPGDEALSQALMEKMLARVD